MSKIIDWLYDKLGNTLIPKTVTKAVYDSEGNSLDGILSGLESSVSDANNQISTLKSNINDKQNKTFEIIGVSTDGGVIWWDLSNYSELIIVGAKSNEVVSTHYDTSLIINNEAVYWFGTMVAQSGLVFKVIMKNDSLSPQWCFANSHNSDLSGTVIYVYAR